jgi:hypothetical protein
LTVRGDETTRRRKSLLLVLPLEGEKTDQDVPPSSLSPPLASAGRGKAADRRHRPAATAIASSKNGSSCLRPPLRIVGVRLLLLLAAEGRRLLLVLGCFRSSGAARRAFSRGRCRRVFGRPGPARS